MHVWWGVQQARNDPHAAFIPRVIKLAEDVTGRALPLWRMEVRELFSDLFLKGLWDSKTPYMDRYLSHKMLTTSQKKE